MHWLTGVAVRPGLIEEYTRTTGAVLAGRDGFDSAIGDARPYGGAWQGPVFVLTHHPEDARPTDGITVLSCPVVEAVQIALDAAGGKNVEVFSPPIERVGDSDPASTVNVRYRPVTTGRSAAVSTSGCKPQADGAPC